jgi:asparaginyl-tRNA synthetase
MKYTPVRSFYENMEIHHDQEVTIGGWIRTNRASNRFGFIELNDGSSFKGIQVVYEDDLENFMEVGKLGVAAAITVTGRFLMTPEGKQPFEIKASKVILEAASDSMYPLQKKRHTLEYLRTIAHLRPRSNTFSAVFRVRSLASYAVHRFFQERGFVHVHTPIITASDAEGAGEMFHVTTLDLDQVPKAEDGLVDYKQDFFEKPANLTVSGQLEGEIFALAFKNIYTFGPTFRAENSNTPRHAAEFWMIEPEIAFADLNDDMDLAEDMIKYLIEYVLEHAPQEMDFFQSFMDKGLMERLQGILSSQFQRITYTRAVELLQESGKDFEYPIAWGADLQTEHERYLTEEVFKKPVFVTDYPKEIKAFYMRLNDDGKTVAAMDLLVPGVGEIIGGSQREERYEVLRDRILASGLSEEDYWWYLELRKYGGVRHAGFGLGFERLIMYLTGMTNIRDVIPFPRTAGNAEF